MINSMLIVYKSGSVASYAGAWVASSALVDACMSLNIISDFQLSAYNKNDLQGMYILLVDVDMDPHALDLIISSALVTCVISPLTRSGLTRENQSSSTSVLWLDSRSLNFANIVRRVLSGEAAIFKAYMVDIGADSPAKVCWDIFGTDVAPEAYVALYCRGDWNSALVNASMMSNSLDYMDFAKALEWPISVHIAQGRIVLAHIVRMAEEIVAESGRNCLIDRYSVWVANSPLLYAEEVAKKLSLRAVFGVAYSDSSRFRTMVFARSPHASATWDFEKSIRGLATNSSSSSVQPRILSESTSQIITVRVEKQHFLASF